jgi:phosphopantothenoylcysteine synthetase/decarboxylase
MITWNKQTEDRFHYTLEVEHPEMAFESRFKIDVIGNNVQFIDYQAFGSDNKTRKTFESHKEAVEWAENKKEQLSMELKEEGWENT